MSTIAPSEKPALDLALIPPELTRAVESTELAVESRVALRDAFAPHFIKAAELIESAGQIAVNDPEGARLKRLELKAVRVACDKTRKGLKDDILVRGRAIDGINAILEAKVAPLELKLDGIEKAEAIAAAERKAALKKEREAALQAFGLNTNFYPLGEMPPEAFAELLANTKLAHETRLEAARKVEADRIAAEEKAEAARREAAALAAKLAEESRIENERLKKEIAEQEEARRQENLRQQALREVERQKFEAERAEIQRKADEAERATKAAQLETQRIAAEAAAKQKEINDRIAAEQAEADRLAEIEREKARKAAAAPDRDKLEAMLAQFRAVQIPAMSTSDGKDVADDIIKQHARFITWVKQKINTL